MTPKRGITSSNVISGRNNAEESVGGNSKVINEQ
jgi:hypothetical protein